jgi:hypothetical protein
MKYRFVNYSKYSANKLRAPYFKAQCEFDSRQTSPKLFHNFVCVRRWPLEGDCLVSSVVTRELSPHEHRGSGYLAHRGSPS